MASIQGSKSIAILPPLDASKHLFMGSNKGGYHGNCNNTPLGALNLLFMDSEKEGM
jgi:hypothetical protein